MNLDIEGFTAFRDRLELDLEPLDLFAITGPTGAGKSSIIDAICYALYGRVPRVANEIKDCIAQGLPRMAVTLDFQAGDDRWRVFRETRRQGQANVRLERFLEGEWQAISHGAREVSERIERIVGLSYDAFTRSVLLPQGQFQEFLSGSPDKRREVLQSLLRTDVYGRMQKRAGEIAGQKRFEVQQFQNLLDQTFADATPENLARRRDELAVARSESEALARKAAVWNKASKLAQSFATAALARDKAQADYARTSGEASQARRVADEGDEVLARLESAVAEIEAAIATNDFDPDLLTAITAGANLALAAEASLRRHNEAQSTVKIREVAAEAAGKAAVAAAAALGGASDALDQAQHSFMEAQRRNLAAAVQSGLAPGDVCPVCGGKVDSLPSIEAGDLTQAEECLRQAKQKREVEQEAHTQATARKASAGTAFEAAREALEQCKAQAQADRKRLEDALPGVQDRSAATLQEALRRQKEAREARLTLNRRLEDAQKSLNSTRVDLSAARNDLATKDQLLRAQQEALASAESAVAEARSALEACAEEERLQPLREALATAADPSRVAEREMAATAARNTEVQQDIGRLESLVDHIKDGIEKAAQVRAQQKEAQAGLDVAHDLSQMLQANKFQAFVQVEALRILAVEGSRRLQALSGGRYRLGISQTGQDFEAIDQWNADDKRSVKTLSGGETFLASLALALALAESLPGLAPDRTVALDAIFLDEGFGSLDPEALDRAAEALDSLRDGRRMVCVVTHLPELAQRLPARIVVEKSETGSRAAIA